MKNPTLDVLSETAPPTSEHFTEFVSNEELAKLGKGLIPQNTTKCTKWALKIFELWKNTRNQQFQDNKIPEDLFLSTDPRILSIHLTRFAVEARNSNGEHYPPSSIHQLLCGILRDINPDCFNFLDKKDAQFRQLHHALDVQFHKLHSDGIGRQVNHTEVISNEEEQKLGESGVLEVSNPLSLQNAVFTQLERCA